MSRNLALIAMFAGGILQAGCRDSGTSDAFVPADLSVKGDGGGGGGNDLSTTKMYTTMTPNAIDTGGGSLKNMAVKVTGVVTTTPVNAFTASKKTVCKYDVVVQDPACTTPPCGIVLQETGMMNAAGVTTTQCIQAKGMTMLGGLMVGDKVDAAGVVDIFPDMMNSAIAQHSITLDTVTKTGTGTITPIMVTDPPMATANSNFVLHVTGSWSMYEGTLITVVPPTGSKLAVEMIDTATPYDFYTSPPSPGTPSPTTQAAWSTNYRYTYGGTGGDAGAFPALHSQWSSITGVVLTIFGGSVAPRFMQDFKP